MDKKALNKIKKQLLAEKKQLEKSLESFAEKNRKVKGDYNTKFPYVGDSAEDSATEVAMFSDNLSLERDLEKNLRDVNKALQKIADGVYGTCQYCRQPIPEGRLLARPASTACIKCKTDLKSKLRR